MEILWNPFGVAKYSPGSQKLLTANCEEYDVPAAHSFLYKAINHNSPNYNNQ